MTETSIDVLVIGAGPVGLFCANELARHGLQCRIFDKKNQLSDKSKALGIHIRTLDVMEDCGFIEEILAQGQQINKAAFKSNGASVAHITFTEVEADRHFLIDLPQDQTERILYEGLKSRQLDVEWQCELTDVVQDEDGVLATFTDPNGKTETVRASWLIACDGAHSSVRHVLEMEFYGSEYKQNWWLADLLIDWNLPPDQMTIYLHPKGPLACFPMKNKRYRLVLTAPHEGEPEMRDIVAAFNQRSSDTATLSDPVWITKFNLHHRQIQQYKKGRIFFAGDAAHIHSPMGGQGLNTGIQDIYNLVWKLALVHKKLAQESVLDSYHAERYPVGRAVLKKTDLMTRMILLKNPFLIALRNSLISMMLSIKYIKNKLATDIAELDISYAKSPIVADYAQGKHIKAGVFLSDFNLSDKMQQMRSFHSIVQGTVHHLFLFTGLSNADNNNLVSLAQLVTEKYRGLVIAHLVLRQGAILNDWDGTVWYDHGNVAHERFNMINSCVILVRPDKYVGLVQSPIQEKALMHYLEGIFRL